MEAHGADINDRSQLYLSGGKQRNLRDGSQLHLDFQEQFTLLLMSNTH
jgi:hypothetical protein